MMTRRRRRWKSMCTTSTRRWCPQSSCGGGKTIVGKAHCENFCLSGAVTPTPPPGAHPYKKGLLGRRLSSGSAVLVALGVGDMALGGDQGGSIRKCVAFCGTYGMKPTHGLVPYTGNPCRRGLCRHTGRADCTVATMPCFWRSWPARRLRFSRQNKRQDAPLYPGAERRHKGHEIGLVTEGFA